MIITLDAGPAKKFSSLVSVVSVVEVVIDFTFAASKFIRCR